MQLQAYEYEIEKVLPVGAEKWYLVYFDGVWRVLTFHLTFEDILYQDDADMALDYTVYDVRGDELDGGQLEISATDKRFFSLNGVLRGLGELAFDKTEFEWKEIDIPGWAQ